MEVSILKISKRHARRGEGIVYLRAPYGHTKGASSRNLAITHFLTFIYKVAHLAGLLGWVDFDFDCSTFCLVLLGLMGKRQKKLSNWVRLRNITD